MTYGLYDIDLWHSGKAPPSLDLMKYYTYLMQHNHKVIMMKPKMDEGRFNKIIYFKESPRKNIPVGLALHGENKILRGAGFYGVYQPLKPEIAACVPDFTPYDPFCSKVSCDSYENLRRSSIVRLSPEDFTGFKPEAKFIYVVDQNVLGLENFTDYFDKYSDKVFYFLNALKAKSDEQAESLKPLLKHFEGRVYLDFQFNVDTLIKYAQLNRRKYVISGEKKRNETVDEYNLRFIKMALAFKHFNTKHNIMSFDSYNELTILIAKWIKSNQPISFKDYYKKDFSVLQMIYDHPYRHLLRQDPATFDTENLDFWHNI